MLSSLLLATAILIPQVPTASKTPQADPYTVEHVSIVWKDVEVAVKPTKRPFDALTLALTSRTTLSLRVTAPSLQSVVLMPGCPVPEVTDERGTTLRRPDTGAVRRAQPEFRLARPAKRGEVIRITVQCKLSAIETIAFSLGMRDNAYRDEMVPAAFRYTFLFPSDYIASPPAVRPRGLGPRTTWDFTMTLPSEYQVVSNGRMASDESARANQHTVRWEQDRPTEFGVFVVAVGNYTLIREEWKDSAGRIVPVTVAVPATQDTAGARLFARDAVQGIEFFSRLTGVQFPWAGRNFVAGFGKTGGLNVASVTYFSRWDQFEEPWSGLPTPQGYLDRPRTTNSVLIHEMAHDWFGSFVNVNSMHRWLTEGLSDYLTAQYLGLRWGPRAEQEFLYFYNLPNQDPAAHGALVPLAAERGNPIQPYGGGAYVLNVLRRYLGDDRFWAGLAAYTRANEGATATSEDFRKALEGAANEDLGWFFRQWVYGDRRPAFKVAASYDSINKRVTLQVEQTQGALQFTAPAASGSGVVRDTIGYFTMPLTVRVSTVKGDISDTTKLSGRSQTITIDGVESEPTMILFDAEDGIWKTLIFPQPTVWLVNQLRADPSVWQTWWAIQQLRSLAPSDSLAASALVEAVTAGRHTITRALAAEALDTLGSSNVQAPPSVFPALRAALADTAVRVRRAAAHALRKWPASDVVPVAKAVGTSEASFVVRMQLYQSLRQIAEISAEDRESLARSLRVPPQ